MPLVPHTNHMTDLSITPPPELVLNSQPMTTPLSPAAQAVLDAANSASSYGPDDCLNDARQIAAAALRAAVDHVVADDALYARSCCEFVGSDCRSQLLAIADELEAQQ